MKTDDDKKKFKSDVVACIRIMFLNGFDEFKEWIREQTEKLEAKKIDPEDYLISYTKRKLKLMGNIKFIAYLFNENFLSHKVMRFVTHKLI